MVTLGLLLLILYALLPALHTSTILTLGLILLVAGVLFNLVPLGGRHYRVY